MNYVIPIVPRITGQVTEVPIQPNRPIKKGDVLFKIDPIPFEAAVKAAEATLRGLQDQLKNATAKKAALTPRIDLAKKRVEQFSALATTRAGKRADLSRRKATSAILKANSSPPTPRKRRPGRRLSRPKQTCAIRNLTSRAASPCSLERARGQPFLATRRTRDPVRDNARDELHPGGRPVAAGILPAKRTALRRTRRRSGNLHEGVSGPHHQVQGRFHPLGDGTRPAANQRQPPNTAPISAPEQRIAVRLLTDGKDKDVFLAAGARGQGAIYTNDITAIQILRRVIVRIAAKFDWFVIKHLSALFGGH